MNVSEGTVQAREYFEEQHLNFPFVPSYSEGSLRKIQPALFSTRDLMTSPYDLEAFVVELLSKKVSDYVIVGCAGHGIASRGMHYYAVSDHLAIFFQLSYGNPLRNEKEICDRVNGLFHSIRLFFERIGKAKLEDGKRLLIIESDFYGKGWGWIDDLPGKIDPDSWHEGSSLLESLNEIP